MCNGGYQRYFVYRYDSYSRSSVIQVYVICKYPQVLHLLLHIIVVLL